MANTVMQLKQFFATPDKPVSTKEMMEFWKSLTDDEKAYYTAAAI